MQNKLWDNDAFCPLPWTSVYLQPDGLIDSCCASKNNLGNVNSMSIQEIITGKKNIEIKKNMIDNVVPDGCRICHPNDLTVSKNDFDYQATLKYWYKNLLQNTDKEIYNDAENFKLNYFDLRLKNTCNFGCVYCGPELSSVREIEELTQPQIVSGKVLSIGRDRITKINDNKISEIYKFFEQNVKDIKVLYLAGGEPLYIKENIYFLDKLFEENPDCHVRINTNLSLVDDNKIFEKIIRFKNTFWIVSAEDMHERYDYIRYKGNWNIFVNNLLKLKDLVGVNNISFSMVYFALNAKTIFDCIDYFSSLGFNKETMAVRYIYNGHGIKDAWDPRGLPTSYLNETIKLIETIKTGSDKLDAEIKFVENILKSNFDNDDVYSVFHSFDKFDKMRGLDSRNIFPDIYKFQ